VGVHVFVEAMLRSEWSCSLIASFIPKKRPLIPIGYETTRDVKNTFGKRVKLVRTKPLIKSLGTQIM
jgi:hypothetical protein